MKLQTKFARHSICVTFFFINMIHMQAQYKPGSLANGIIPTVIPPSTEAAGLGKYGEYQVSHYTGVPQISISLYTIKSGSLAVPISISYHGGGVKVDDVESWVGANWSLNAGGVITRTVVGLEDEHIPNGFLYRNQRSINLQASYNSAVKQDWAFLKKVREGLIDTEPDIFTFNFGGMSGRFFFDETGKFQSIPANALKLLRCPVANTLDYTTDLHWEIADTEGNIYHFGTPNNQGIEKSLVYVNAPIISQMKITAWYLTKIISKNYADTITFAYTDKLERYDLPYAHSYRILNGNIGTEIVGDLKINQVLYNGQLQNDQINGPALPNTFMASGKSRLNEIKWNDGRIVLTADITRTDIEAKMLSTIELFDNENTKHRKFDFKYGVDNYRYYLDTLIESGKDLSKLLKHNFEYTQRTIMPVRGSTSGQTTSLAQDHWGYYNGQNSNGSLLPNTSYLALPFTCIRECSEQHMSFGSLKRIYYPTGGYTEFEFEPNRFNPQQVPGDTVVIVVQKTTIAAAEIPQTSTYQKTRTFNIPFNQSNATIAIQFKNYNKPPEATAGWLPYVRIEKLIGSTYQEVRYWDAFVNFPVGNAPPQNQYGFIDFNLAAQFLTLDPGSYRLTTDVICGTLNCGTPLVHPSVVATLKYYDNDVNITPPTMPSPIIGGLRIKTISSYSYNNSLSGRKAYSYNPGKVLYYPRYFNEYIEDVYNLSACSQDLFCDPTCDPVIEARFKEITSYSQTIPGFTQGSSVGYSMVEEQEVDATGKANGKTVYNYTFVEDEMNEMQAGTPWNFTILNPSMPSNSYEYKRGLLISKSVYSTLPDGSFYLLDSLKNTYSYNDNSPSNRYKSLKALRVKQMRFVNYNCGEQFEGFTYPTVLNSTEKDFAYAFYNLLTSWVQLTSSVNTVYSASGGIPMTATTNYSYENSVHLQPTSTSTTNSSNEVIKTVNKYPHDFAGTGVYDSMIARNQISPIIEQIIYRNDVDELVRKKTNYAFWNGTAIIAPASEYTSLKAATSFKTMNYDSYDITGNLTQYTSQDGIVTSLVYGYNYNKLVAKIAGANQAAIASKITVANIQGMTGSTLRTELNKLRSISGALTTSYTYDPLVGMTSQSDSNNLTIHYEYDILGRIRAIKDNNLNVLKTFEYQYQIPFNQ